MQYGYSYDVTNGVTPYTSTQTTQRIHTPVITVPSGTAASLATSAGLQSALRAGLHGSALWSVAAGMQQDPALSSIKNKTITQPKWLYRGCAQL